MHGSPHPTPHTRKRKALIAGALVLGSISCGLLVLEVGYRILESDPKQAEAREDLRDLIEHGSKHFRPWAYVGFIPKPREAQKGDTTRPVDWSFTFEDHAHPRVACLGGSTTWGGYPAVLQRSLKNATQTKWDVMNWGVSGWTTAETMVNYFLNVQDYEPDVLIIHHSLNDVPARAWGGYRGDYANYRRPWIEPHYALWERKLFAWSDWYADHALKSQPWRYKLDEIVSKQKTAKYSTLGPVSALDPTTSAAFERNIRTIIVNAKSKGTRVVLMTMPYRPSEGVPLVDGSEKLWVGAMKQHNQLLRDLAAELDCVLVDAEAWSRTDPTGTEVLFVDRVHMTHDGTQAKVNLILVAMQKAGWEDLAQTKKQ